MTASEAGIVTWQDSYSVGTLEIDEQHQALFDLINQLWAVLVKSKGGHGPEVLRLIEELEHYTVSHFTAEEIFMTRTGFPGLADHQALHHKFIGRIAAERQAVSQGRPLSLDLLHFLKDWLVGHIMVQDQQYAAFYHGSQKKLSGLGSLFKRFWS